MYLSFEKQEGGTESITQVVECFPRMQDGLDSIKEEVKAGAEVQGLS